MQMRMLMEDTEKRSASSFRKINPVWDQNYNFTPLKWLWLKMMQSNTSFLNNTSIWRNFDLKIDNKFLTTSQIVLAYDFWDWV